ncbi:Conserved_hypothetical protein [Hexamita inflata]|uniref:MORN repeat protein n=1 Tax=Hexamita inflata TaxID=28002 RepID=A0AA86PRG7_9EUKA|nr:Conserved hypothetical protein [Hexamita inflata]
MYYENEIMVKSYNGDFINGSGTLIFDGKKYVGELKNGQFHGSGTMTTVHGIVTTGNWDYGKLIL